jgi:hypothetical protein
MVPGLVADVTKQNQADLQALANVRKQLEAHADPEGKADPTEKAGLEAKQKELEARVAQQNKDLIVLNNPGADPKDINDILARRGAQGSSPQTSSSSDDLARQAGAGGVRIGPGGITSSNTNTTNVLAGGTSATATQTKSTTLDSTGVTRTSADGVNLVTGNQTTSTSRSDSTRVGMTPDGGVGGTSTTTNRSSQTNTDSGVTASSTTTSSTTIGTGGATSTVSQTNQVGNMAVTNTSSFGVTRGDGSVSAQGTSTRSQGEVDDKGKLVKGTETTATGGVSIISGDKGSGAGANVGGTATNVSSADNKQTISGGVYGSFTVNVTPVTGADPPKYQITSTLNLGARVSLGASRSPEQGGNAAASASGGAQVTAVFTHVMEEPEAKQYLNTIAAGGGASSGASREIAILQALKKEGPAAAQAMYLGTQAAVAGDPNAAKAMKDGDSTEVDTQAGGDVKLSAGGKDDGMGAGVNVTAGATKGFTLKVGKEGDRVVITATPRVETTYGGGVDFSAGAAGGGAGASHKDFSSQSVTFSLNPNAPDYASVHKQITTATDIETLRGIARAHPDLVKGQSVTAGSTDSTNVKANVGPVNVGIGQSATTSTTSSVGPDNKVTTTHAGSNTGGMSIGLGEKGPKIATSETQAANVTVNPDGTASGDISATQTDTSFNPSGVIDKAKANPIGTAVGVVTGGTPLTKDQTDTTGMKLSDGDINNIMAAATYPKGWDKHVVSNLDRKDWISLRHKIVAAGSDKNAVARAIAQFVGASGGERAQALERVVRPLGTADGGAAYEWPGELSAQKAEFSALVDSDPLTIPRANEKSGNAQGALNGTHSVIKRLDDLSKALNGKADLFSDRAKLGEMQSRITARRTAASNYAAQLSRAIQAAAGPTTVPTADEVAAQQKADADAARSRAKDEYDRHIGDCKNFEREQAKQFGIVQAELAKKDAIFSKPDQIVMMKALNKLRDTVYPSWDEVVKKAKEAAVRAGLDPWAVCGPLVPAREWWQKLHKDGETGYGSGL